MRAAEASTTEPAERFVISAFGEDQPGIVRRFSQYLAGKDINIVDLYGDRNGTQFVLIGQVEVPTRWDVRMMQTDLEQMGQELGFTVKLQHENVFVATNQLRLKQGVRSRELGLLGANGARSKMKVELSVLLAPNSQPLTL